MQEQNSIHANSPLARTKFISPRLDAQELGARKWLPTHTISSEQFSIDPRFQGRNSPSTDKEKIQASVVVSEVALVRNSTEPLAK